MGRRGVFPMLSIRSQYNIQPRDIYNFDETGTRLGPEFTSYVSGPLWKRSILRKEPTNKEWVTILSVLAP